MRISELKEKVSLETVLLHYGAELSYRAWNTWESLRCIAHDDRQASAAVNLEAQQYRCFACDAAGDQIDLVMYIEDLPSVSEALAWMESTFLDPASGDARG